MVDLAGHSLPVGERGSAREKLEDEDAKRPNVGSLVVGLVGDPLAPLTEVAFFGVGEVFGPEVQGRFHRDVVLLGIVDPSLGKEFLFLLFDHVGVVSGGQSFNGFEGSIVGVALASIGVDFSVYFLEQDAHISEQGSLGRERLFSVG